MKRPGKRAAIALSTLAAISGAIYLFNASWRVGPPPDARIGLIAHRGVHQTFHRQDLDNETCTAARIDPPRHDFIENTIPSMAAAFAAGADIVELDVHPTTDGHFAVLHDWTVDCRTEGTGVTREHDLGTLKSLDVGHGYTADGGATFPLRGKGVGLMPELGEVFAAFPEGRFLVNFKSREAREGDMLAALIAGNPQWRANLWGVYGGDEPSRRAAGLIGALAAAPRRGVIDCLVWYALTGWLGMVPEACRDTLVMVPLNAAPWLWGWPDLFVARMREAGSVVILLGDYESGDSGSAGIDTPEALARVPASFSGYVWTNRIEVIGPALGRAND